MRTEISLFVSLLALFFAAQMASGSIQTPVWPAKANIRVDIVPLKPLHTPASMAQLYMP